MFAASLAPQLFDGGGPITATASPLSRRAHAANAYAVVQAAAIVSKMSVFGRWLP
jgi:hypothetical protein